MGSWFGFSKALATGAIRICPVAVDDVKSVGATCGTDANDIANMADIEDYHCSICAQDWNSFLYRGSLHHTITLNSGLGR